ncbi:sugar ABC transporter substrate-binding protein [Cryptosporangium sp. NPDC051539]|uniref:sugar ABC transporter substrate-binding protein n=1 Tax=Cryptosporangium sp. NPDC051539 TaxID=3363962 RepID=UPI00379E0ADC
MYRVAATLVALLLTLTAGTTACGGDAPRRGTPSVGLVVTDQAGTPDDLGLGYAAGVDRVGGVDSIVTGPPAADGRRQVKMFAALRKRARAGMAVETLSPGLFARPMAAAVDDGVPVMSVDTVPDHSARVRLYVGNDDYALGTMLADRIVQRIPDGSSATVVLGTSEPGARALDARARGLRARLAAEHPGLTVLGPYRTGRNAGANRKAWEALVAAHPAALAFLGTGENDGINLAAIRRRTHGLWLAGAYDLNPESLTALRQGELVALVSPEHYLTGMIAGQLQARAARHTTPLPTGWIVTPGDVVTTANVAEYEERQASAASKKAWAQPRADAFLKDLGAHTRPLSDARQ